MPYTREEVDGLVTSLEKRIEKLQGAMNSPVKRTAAERDVLSSAEEVRNLLKKAVGDDKTRLHEVFGGEYADIRRIRHAFSVVEFSDMHKNDCRWSNMKEACSMIEEVLKGSLLIHKPWEHTANGMKKSEIRARKSSILSEEVSPLISAQILTPGTVDFVTISDQQLLSAVDTPPTPSTADSTEDSQENCFDESCVDSQENSFEEPSGNLQEHCYEESPIVTSPSRKLDPLFEAVVEAFVPGEAVVEDDEAIGTSPSTAATVGTPATPPTPSAEDFSGDLQDLDTTATTASTPPTPSTSGDSKENCYEECPHDTYSSRRKGPLLETAQPQVVTPCDKLVMKPRNRVRKPCNDLSKREFTPVCRRSSNNLLVQGNLYILQETQTQVTDSSAKCNTKQKTTSQGPASEQRKWTPSCPSTVQMRRACSMRNLHFAQESFFETQDLPAQPQVLPAFSENRNRRILASQSARTMPKD